MGVWFCLYNKCILMNFLCYYCRELFFLGRWLPAVRRQKSETTANNCWTRPGTMIKCIRCLFSIRPDTRKKRFADTFYIFFTTSSIEFTYRSKHTEPNEVNWLFICIKRDKITWKFIRRFQKAVVGTKEEGQISIQFHRSGDHFIEIDFDETWRRVVWRKRILN